MRAVLQDVNPAESAARTAAEQSADASPGQRTSHGPSFSSQELTSHGPPPSNL